MKIYHLTPIDFDSFANEHMHGTEPKQTWGAVVVAPDEGQARRVASQAGGEAWLDKTVTNCEELKAEDYEVSCLILDEPPWVT